MFKRKYQIFLLICTLASLTCYSNTNQESNNINTNDTTISAEGIICYSENNFQGNSFILKPGNYRIEDLQVIKSIRIPEDYEIMLSDSNTYDSENSISYPALSTSIEGSNPQDIKSSKNVQTSSNSNNNNKEVSNIDCSNYKYLYVAKLDINTENGIAACSEYDEQTHKYFGRGITNIENLNNNIEEIIIDSSPEFTGLPDISQCKNLHTIKYLLNVCADQTALDNEISKIINFIDKVKPLRDIEIQSKTTEYSKTQNNKFFGFNLSTLQNIPISIKEIYLIDCKNLSDIPNINKYKNLKKIYMYGSTLANANWENIIQQLDTLSINDNLTHIYLPRSFTGEIRKSTNPHKSKIEYYGAQGATGIAPKAFCEASKLKEIYFPQVKTIGEESFRKCQSLETVYLPRCETVNNYGFYFTKRLQVVNLPIVKTIGDSAFMWASDAKLKIGDINNFQVAFGNTECSALYLPYCESIGKYAFRSDHIDKVAFEKVSIPKCKKIGELAFEWMRNLKEVNVPQLETVEEGAFRRCFSLTKFGDLKLISESTGFNTPLLKTVEKIAFEMDDETQTKIQQISLPICETIEEGGFRRWRSVKKLSAPKCKTIKKEACYDFYKLNTLELPEVETIGERAFVYNQQSFSGVLNLPKCKTIGKQAFAGSAWAHAKITEVNAPECTDISEDAFMGSNTLNTIKAPKVSNNKLKTIIRNTKNHL